MRLVDGTRQRLYFDEGGKVGGLGKQYDSESRTVRSTRAPDETTKLVGVDPLQLQTGFLIHPVATACGDPIMITQEYSTCSNFNSCGMNEYGFHIVPYSTAYQ
jgi:hypothetical protein